MRAVRTRALWAPTFYALGTLVLVIGALRYAAPLLVPVGIAVLLAFLLSPAVQRLERTGIPRLVAVGVVVAGLIIVISALGWTVAHQTNQLLDAFPRYEDNLRRKLAILRSEDGTIFTKLREIARKVDQEISGEPATKPPSERDAVKVTVVKPETELSLANLPVLAGAVAPPLAGMVLCLALFAFMLMRREDLRERVVGLAGRSRMSLTTRAMEEAWERITRTLLAQFGINAGFGALYGIGLYAIGIPFAVLWGVLAIVLRYIPFIGSSLSLALPFAVSVLMMQGWHGPLLVLALFSVLVVAAIGTEAWLVGPGIGVSPTGTLMMLGFWTWVWGPIALIVATPLTACLMVLARFLPRLKFIEVAFGDRPALDAPERLYQRLLSRDIDEAQRLFNAEVNERSFVAACDDLLLPSVLDAVADLERQRIGSEEAEAVFSGAKGLLVAPKARNSEAASPDRSVASGSILRVYCIARDAVDRLCCLMLHGVLDREALPVDLRTGDLLVSETVQAIGRRDVDVVCIACSSPRAMLAARLICRRLRRRVPGIPILVGNWSGRTDARELDGLRAAGASRVCQSIDEMRLALVERATLRPSASPATADLRA